MTALSVTKSTKNVGSSQELMTIKQLAESLGISYDTVNHCVKRIFPTKLKHGKTTYFTEQEVACISKELKNNSSVLSHQTVEVSSTVSNSFTALELQANFYAASQAYAKFLESENKRLQNEKEQAEQKVIELTPDAENWRALRDSNGMFSMTKIANTLNFKAKDGFSWFAEHGYIAREQTKTEKVGKWMSTYKGVKAGLVRNVVWIDKIDGRSGLSMKLTASGVEKLISLVKDGTIQKK